MPGAILPIEQDILKLVVIILLGGVALGLGSAIAIVRSNVQNWNAVIPWFFVFSGVSIAVILIASGLGGLENVPLFIFTASAIKIVSLAGIASAAMDWSRDNQRGAQVVYARIVGILIFVIALTLCIRMFFQILVCSPLELNLGHTATEFLECDCKDTAYKISERSIYITILWNVFSLLPIMLLASANVWILIDGSRLGRSNVDDSRRFFFGVDVPCLLAALTVFIYIFVARFNVYHQDATLFVSGAMTFLVFAAFWAERLILATGQMHSRI